LQKNKIMHFLPHTHAPHRGLTANPPSNVVNKHTLTIWFMACYRTDSCFGDQYVQICGTLNEVSRNCCRALQGQGQLGLHK